MSNSFPKLHNAMWPGLVGKASQGGEEPDISLDRMLELTANAEVDGTKFDGIDYFLFHPHTDPDASDDELETRFGFLASTTDLHPLVLYQALCEGIGKVALWDDLRRPRDLPPYNHDECGTVFAELFRYLRSLIDGMLPRTAWS